MYQHKSVHLLILVILFLATACKHDTLNYKKDLSNIDLRRGEVLLCGDEEFGELSFFVSCKNSTRKTFNLAVSLLHSFEYLEAEKVFVSVIDQDPNCAMAYWGIAMSIYHTLWFAPNEQELEKGRSVLKIASSIPTSEREQEYLDAIGAYFSDWNTIDHETRAKKMELKMESIYQKYPEDTEAAIFYALALRSTADPNDTEYLNQKKAGKILVDLFPDQPNHPGIAHYIIHNYDYPELAHLSLSTARRYADIAPSSAHAQHMPSHIFTRMGLWEESITSNVNSAEAARCYAQASELVGHWDAEIHAIDYLVYAYLQQGDNENALKQYDYLKTVKKIVSLTGPYNFGAVPARIYLENRQWKSASEMEFFPSDIDWEQYPWEQAIKHFTRAIGASYLKKFDNAHSEVIVLSNLRDTLLVIGDPYKAKQVDVQVKTSLAWINFFQGNLPQGLTLMQEAASLEDSFEKHPKTPGEIIPARELLGDMFLAMNKPKEALIAYEANLIRNPNRFNGLYGAAIAAKRNGDANKAKIYFQALLKLSINSNSDRKELLEAKAFVG